MAMTKMKTALGAVVLVGALTGLAAPAQAAVTHTEHSSFDPTGASFSCQNGDLVVLGGTVDEILHYTIDNQGVFHITDTITPHGVTLAGADGTLYRLSGASWFGGKALGMSEPIVFTDTEHFVIRYASGGGVYAKVQVVAHASPNGKTFTFDLGACESPQD